MKILSSRLAQRLEDTLSSVLLSLNVPSYSAVEEPTPTRQPLSSSDQVGSLHGIPFYLRFYTIEPVSFNDACCIPFLERNCEVLPQGQR